MPDGAARFSVTVLLEQLGKAVLLSQVPRHTSMFPGRCEDALVSDENDDRPSQPASATTSPVPSPPTSAWSSPRSPATASRPTWTGRAKLHQPYGIVHGGVHCAVVETLASVGAATWFATGARSSASTTTPTSTGRSATARSPRPPPRCTAAGPSRCGWWSRCRRTARSSPAVRCGSQNLTERVRTDRQHRSGDPGGRGQQAPAYVVCGGLRRGDRQRARRAPARSTAPSPSASGSCASSRRASRPAGSAA